MNRPSKFAYAALVTLLAGNICAALSKTAIELYIATCPGASADNVITPTNDDVTSLVINSAQESGEGGFDIFRVNDKNGNPIFQIGSDGDGGSIIYFNGFVFTRGIGIVPNDNSGVIGIQSPNSISGGYGLMLPASKNPSGGVLKSDAYGNCIWY